MITRHVILPFFVRHGNFCQTKADTGGRNKIPFIPFKVYEYTAIWFQHFLQGMAIFVTACRLPWGSIYRNKRSFRAYFTEERGKNENGRREYPEHLCFDIKGNICTCFRRSIFYLTIHHQLDGGLVVLGLMAL